ncbi:MAG: hypothetical protein IKS41_06790 [Alphaproteobacteria bacterium]|nr:hypothetical protein [Alphaproteobacteria bacterium]
MRRLFAILLVMLFLQGCASGAKPSAPFMPSTGIIYTHIKAPLSLNVEKTEVSEKRGRSSDFLVAYSAYGVGFGRAGLEDTLQELRRKNKVLETVDYADYEWFSILGIFNRLTVNAYGTGLPKKSK